MTKMVHVQKNKKKTNKTTTKKNIEIGNTAMRFFSQLISHAAALCCLHFTRELLCWAWHYKSSFGHFIITLKMGVRDLYAELRVYVVWYNSILVS